MEKINCTIERITFQNLENGYSVLQATVKGYREEQTIVGTFHEVTVGAWQGQHSEGAGQSLLSG
jgi:exodeoxyribonuclease V alpha subunit